MSKEPWIGDDDNKTVFVQRPADKDGKFSLEPMRIRTFAIEYKEEQPKISTAEVSVVEKPEAP